jgi:hypothetical protein
MVGLNTHSLENYDYGNVINENIVPQEYPTFLEEDIGFGLSLMRRAISSKLTSKVFSLRFSLPSNRGLNNTFGGLDDDSVLA